ncbi:MAG: sulfatase-like hydrolase/transferase, partial [Verrucomicrobiae bacterium]|nr:sulfatase-like hydrolase/transferase [Verrucomicrobiae bacterium]
TWPQLLRQKGYRTAIFGKWHLGIRPESSPKEFGYDNASLFKDGPGGATKMDPLMEIDGVQQPMTGFGGDIITGQAIEFIKENARKGPVLVSLHLREPHIPYEPVPDIDDKVYRNRKIEEIPEWPGLDRQWAEDTMRSYYKSVASIDRNVGRLLDTLDDLKLSDNTVVIYSSDHGYMIGHNGVYGKGTATYAGGDIRSASRRPNMFDNAIRVPLLIRWPEVIRPGMRIKQMVTNLDYFPTLLTIADAQSLLPDDYPIFGRDFTPLLRGELVQWRTVIFGDYDMYHYVKDSMRMIRTEDWKLVMHTHLEFPPELYDLRNDPGERVNLANRIDYFDTYLDLRRRLYRWQVWMADPGRIAPWEPQ